LYISNTKEKWKCRRRDSVCLGGREVDIPAETSESHEGGDGGKMGEGIGRVLQDDCRQSKKTSK